MWKKTQGVVFSETQCIKAVQQRTRNEHRL